MKPTHEPAANTRSLESKAAYSGAASHLHVTEYAHRNSGGSKSHYLNFAISASTYHEVADVFRWLGKDDMKLTCNQGGRRLGFDGQSQEPDGAQVFRLARIARGLPRDGKGEQRASVFKWGGASKKFSNAQKCGQ